MTRGYEKKRRRSGKQEKIRKEQTKNKRRDTMGICEEENKKSRGDGELNRRREEATPRIREHKKKIYL